MKKTLIFSILIAAGAATALRAQVGVDSTSTGISAPVAPAVPAATPVAVPPPPPPPVAAPVTTTTVTSTTAPAAPAAPVVTSGPVYNTPRINVNKLRFGAFVAPNISWMKPTAATDDANKFNTQSNGSKLGFTYGLMVDYFFAENYGLVTGLSINSTGGKIQADAKDNTVGPSKVRTAEFDYRLQYLDVPLALKLRTDDINRFRFFAQLGVSLGFNISKKADYTVSYYDEASTLRDTSGTKIKLTGSVTNIAPIMFQMNIGTGAEYPFNNKLSAYIGIFFNNGFAPDTTNPQDFDEAKLGYQGSFRDANTRLNNFALRIGLFF